MAPGQMTHHERNYRLPSEGVPQVKVLWRKVFGIGSRDFASNDESALALPLSRSYFTTRFTKWIDGVGEVFRKLPSG